MSLAGILVTLVVAYSFDRLLESLQQTFAKPFDPFAWGQSLFLTVIIHLLFAALLLLLAWYVLFKNERNGVVSTVFLVIGGLLLFDLTFFGFLPTSILPAGEFRNVLMALFFLSSKSLLFQASAFISVIGIAGLVLRSQR